MVRAYLDLEYLYPGMTKASGRPSDTDKRQIVQIAAIAFDTVSGVELNSIDILTRPVFDTMLPDFFIELTGIAQNDVDAHAISLSEGLDKLADFLNGRQVYVFEKDGDVIDQNCRYIDKRFPIDTRSFIRVKPLLSQWNVDATQYSSGTLYRAAGIDMPDAQIHNALHDVRSMAYALQALEADSIC